MSGKTDAWMPLWIGAYLADTQHLSRDEHGGYLLMLMAYWRAGGPLPDDDKRLSAIAKASPKEWKELRPTLAEFFTIADGVWTHKRVEQELISSLERKEKAGSKAKTAAEARWRDHVKHAPSNAPSTPQALHEECPTPSPSLLRKEGEPRKRVAPLLPVIDGIPEGLMADYLVVRKAKKGGALTQTAIAGLQREADLAGVSLLVAIEACCEYGWIGFNAKWYADRKGSTSRTQPTGETAYQRSMRERMEQIAPGIAAKPPGYRNNIIEMEAPRVIARSMD